MDWSERNKAELLKRKNYFHTSHRHHSVSRNYLLAILIWTGNVAFISPAYGMCPEKCVCDDTNLFVTCNRASLEVMPNTLNPRLKRITYTYNDFPSVDVSLM